MATHRLDPHVFYTTHGQHPPALRVQPGDTVILHTLDARGRDRESAPRGERPNPQSGPIWVEGAEPICAGLISAAALMGICDALLNVFMG